MKKNLSTWRLIITSIIMVSLLTTGCGITQKSITKKQEPRQLQILAVNDMHAAIEIFPRLAYIADSLRAIYPDILLVSGGDNQTGNPVNDQHPQKGMPMVWLMNKVKFDLSALGNHEFDVTAKGMIKNIKESNFDYICSNAIYKDNSHPLKRHKTFVMPNGLRVAFSSLLYINSTGYPDCQHKYTEGFTFIDPVMAAKKEYDTLRKNHDLFIFLNHYGFNEDVKLAYEMPYGGVDLIIGGHSHTKLDQIHEHNGIPITQAASKLKYASLIKITLYPDNRKEYSYELITLPNTGAEDPEVNAMVEDYVKNSGLDVRIATNNKALNRKEQLGYIMADAQRAKGNADIAVVNPGGVRISELAKGDVSMLDIFTLDPFGNEIVTYELTGSELRELLLNAEELDGINPFIPSGIHLRYHIVNNSNNKQRINDIELLSIDNKPLDMDKTYKVVVNNYIASVYNFPKKETGRSLYITTADATIDWLKELGTVPDYSKENRIIVMQ